MSIYLFVIVVLSITNIILFYLFIKNRRMRLRTKESVKRVVEILRKDVKIIETIIENAER